jgi:hypothetical protein
MSYLNYILRKDGLMTVWWPKRVANKINNKILLCLTEANKFVVVFQDFEKSLLVQDSDVIVLKSLIIPWTKTVGGGGGTR